MAAGIFNIAKGRIAYYGDLAEAGTGGAELVAVLLADGQEIDGTLEDYDDLAALLVPAANAEATFAGYSQYTLLSVTVTTDDTANDVTVNCADPTWSPTSAEALGKIIFCYDPDGTNTAASMVPLFHDDFGITTPTSGTITYQVAADGFVTST